MAEERISYSEISSSCSNLTNLASSMSETIDNIQSAINQITDPTWDGTAATSYVEKIKSLCNHLPDANRQLAEAVLFLASVADGYKSIDDASLAKLKELIGGQQYIDNYDVSKAPDIDTNSRVTIEQTKTEPTEEEDKSSGKKTTGTQTGGSSSQTTTSGGGYSGGGYSGGGYSGGGYSGGGGVVTGGTASIVSNVQPAENKQEEEKEKEEAQKIDSLEKGEKAEVPSSLEQDKYGTNIYDKDNKFKAGSDEKALEDIWKSQGSKDENGLATIKVDGEKRYLVKVSPKYGKVGDSIDVNLKDGSVVKCVIAENKSLEGKNASVYGTTGKDGKVSVLEFETKTLGEKEKISYQWDSKSPAKTITNNGNVLNNKAEATKVIENKTYPVPESSTKTATPDTTSTNATENATSTIETSNSNVVTTADQGTGTTTDTMNSTITSTESAEG